MPFVKADATRQDLGRTNRRKVLSHILINGAMPRTEISQRTGLTNASVSRITKEFLEAGLVQEQSETDLANGEKRPGRKFINLEIAPEGGYIIGIGMNAYEQTITLANLANQRLAKRTLDIQSFQDPQQVLQQVADHTADMIKTSGIDQARLLGGSIAITGAIDPNEGIVLYSRHLGWEQVEVSHILTELLNIPFVVENLPCAINLSESRFGITKTKRNVITLNSALGVGCSLMVDGRLLRGQNFQSGLLSQLNITDTNAQKQSVDQLVGGYSVLEQLGIERLQQAHQQHVNAQHLQQIMNDADSGNQTAQTALQHSGYWLARLMDILGNILHPEVFVLAGPLSKSSFYRQGIEQYQNEHTSSFDYLFSQMSSQAAARWLALNEYLVQRDIDLDLLKTRA